MTNDRVGTSAQPNIVYVFADQLRADVLGYAGDTKALTPRIDAFARESVDVTNAVSVMPVCAPYRASLITGKYPSSTGMVINEVNMNPNHRTIAHVLGDAGYGLGYVGKWHLNDQHQRPTLPGPERMGFDDYWASYSFNHKSYESFYFTDTSDGGMERIDLTGQYGPDVFTELGLAYMERAVRDDKPFALFLSWNPPHDPWVKENVPAENYARFRDQSFSLPENFKSEPDAYMDRYPEGDGFDGKSWDQTFLEEGLKERLRCYYAMINSIDEQFGRILDQIDSLGIADNTIVVFTSDHGEMFASQGRMYKLTFYEEAAHIPFLVRYPVALTAGCSDVCLNTPDIMPTLLGFAGLSGSVPEEVEGEDVSGVLRGEHSDGPDFALMQGLGHTYLWEDGYEWRAIRDKRFTYAKYLRDGRELLFDRDEDPHCNRDVIDASEYAAEKARLQACMQQKMDTLDDAFMPCSWYRDHWMYREYSIMAAAKGPFGPLPPIAPNRGQALG